MIQLRSYATLAEFFNTVLHTHWQFPVFSFGFFVGMAFLTAGWILYIELKRKEKDGLLKSTKEKILIGAPVTLSELVMNGIVGFIIGFKVGGMIAGWGTFNENPQHFIF